jgi:hypothetical protein
MKGAFFNTIHHNYHQGSGVGGYVDVNYGEFFDEMTNLIGDVCHFLWRDRFLGTVAMIW